MSASIFLNHAIYLYFSKFIRNSSPLSCTVGIVFIPVSFHGHNIFNDNQGGALQVCPRLHLAACVTFELLNYRLQALLCTCTVVWTWWITRPEAHQMEQYQWLHLVNFWWKTEFISILSTTVGCKYYFYLDHYMYCFAQWSVGAAISVESQDVPDVLSKLLHNPLCFLRYKNSSIPPDSWEDVREVQKFHCSFHICCRSRYTSVVIQQCRHQ